MRIYRCDEITMRKAVPRQHARFSLVFGVLRDTVDCEVPLEPPAGGKLNIILILLFILVIIEYSSIDTL